MNIRIKSTLSAALIAISFVSTGALFGTAPINKNLPTAMIIYNADGSVQLIELNTSKPTARSNGFQRHSEMPFFSFSRTLK